MEQEQKQQHSITDQVLHKLEQEQVTPIGRWHFVLRNNSFWALWGLSVLIGACATAATIFVFLNAGWEYEAITHDSFMQFFFDVMPFFWLVSFGLMVLFGYYNVRHTHRGYRFSFYFVVLSGVVVSMLGGVLLYSLGVGKDIDDFRRPLPFSAPLLMHEESRWNNLEKGLLSGVVKSYDEQTQSLTVTLVGGEDTVLSTRELGDRDRALAVQGTHVRIIGGRDTATTGVFVACVILPWEKPTTSTGMPSPYVQPAQESERKTFVGRSNVCKDVRPYRQYQQIVITK